MNSIKKYLGLGLMALVVSGPVLATATGTAVASDAFDDFAATVIGWLKGGLGIGISISALIVGGGTAAATGKPLIMVGAVIVAMMFAFGPGILQSLVEEGNALVAMVPGLV